MTRREKQMEAHIREVAASEGVQIWREGKAWRLQGRHCDITVTDLTRVKPEELRKRHRFPWERS